MTGPEALSVHGDSPAATADPTAAVAGSSAASQRWPQLIPIAQLVAIILGVFAIIWNQQQSIDSLRTELTADINRVETTLRAELSAEIGELRTEIGQLRTEIGQLRTEIGELRTEVAENSQRLARIEGYLGIGVPEDPQQ